MPRFLVSSTSAANEQVLKAGVKVHLAIARGHAHGNRGTMAKLLLLNLLAKALDCKHHLDPKLPSVLERKESIRVLVCGFSVSRREWEKKR